MRKKLLLVLCFTFIFSMVGCNQMVDVAKENVKENLEELSTGDMDEKQFGMELVGVDGNFTYYRDVNTDSLFVWYDGSYRGGLTQVFDTETGLPMTYTRYMEICNKKSDGLGE